MFVLLLLLSLISSFFAVCLRSCSLNAGLLGPMFAPATAAGMMAAAAEVTARAG